MLSFAAKLAEKGLTLALTKGEGVNVRFTIREEIANVTCMIKAESTNIRSITTGESASVSCLTAVDVFGLVCVHLELRVVSCC